MLIKPKIKSETHDSWDGLLGGKINFLQSKDYRTAIDPILLAAFAATILHGSADISPKNWEQKQIVELGVGTGALMLCYLYHSYHFCRGEFADMPGYQGFDCNADFLNFAQKSVRNNLFSKHLTRLHLQQCDIAQLPQKSSQKSSYDAVFMNPPFLSHEANAGHPRSWARSRALYQGDTPLSVWVQVAANLLVAKGRIFMIHRADKIHEIVTLLNQKFGEIIIYPLYSKISKPAIRVLIAAKRNSKADSLVFSGLYLQEENGDYTPQARAILQGDAGLEIL